MRFRRTDDTTRTARRTARKRSGVPSRTVIAVLAVAGISLLVAGGVAVAKSRAQSVAASATPTVSTAPRMESVASTETTAAASMVEVPVLVGLGVDQARTLLDSAGLLVVTREAGAAGAPGSQPLVTSQQPAAGTVVSVGDTVSLVVPPKAAPAVVAKAAPVDADTFVVCIDPGHQAQSNSTPEPIGPGSKTTKPSVSGGATGVSTDIPEYEIALQISMNLKKRLEAAGIKVVMTRMVNDVDISNSKRAEIANKAGADLFVRIHGDGSPDSSTVGISTLYPAANQWTKPITARSKVAAVAVQKALVSSTGAVNRGAVQRSDLSGFNWAKVPSVLVEAGFLSNPVEDKLLASPHYQDKVAQGIADGILVYRNGAR